uniref:G-protein coupled receptors family 1 profile domain-containing protein n=1 Tax=Petromyzon marinus TaxID=7757 RepID=S4RFF3_PETMA
IVLIVTVKCKKLRQPLTYMLVNISAAGLVFCLFSISTVFLFSTQGYFVFGPTVCALESLFGSMAGLVTGWSLAFLAAERYIVICKPFGNFRFGSIHSLFAFCLTWVLGLGVALPPFFGWSR